MGSKVMDFELVRAFIETQRSRLSALKEDSISSFELGHQYFLGADATLDCLENLISTTDPCKHVALVPHKWSRCAKCGKELDLKAYYEESY